MSDLNTLLSRELGIEAYLRGLVIIGYTGRKYHLIGTERNEGLRPPINWKLISRSSLDQEIYNNLEEAVADVKRDDNLIRSGLNKLSYEERRALGIQEGPVS